MANVTTIINENGAMDMIDYIIINKKRFDFSSVKFFID